MGSVEILRKLSLEITVPFPGGGTEISSERETIDFLRFIAYNPWMDNDMTTATSHIERLEAQRYSGQYGSMIGPRTDADHQEHNHVYDDNMPAIYQIVGLVAIALLITVFGITLI